MTFNSKGFQPLMALNSALARSIKGNDAKSGA